MLFNVNDKVLVKLNDYGRSCLIGDGRTLPKEDKNGWSEWQLWCLMEELGPHLMMGQSPFESDIKISLKDLREDTNHKNA